MDKENLTTFILVTVGLIFLIWLIYPKFIKHQSEQFEEQMETPDDLPVEENMPNIDVQTGSIIDGPGFETNNDIQGTVEQPPSTIPSNYYFLDDGAGGEMSIQHNLCSKSCCSEQWPTPFKQKYDPYVCQNKDKFVPSKIFCNNSFQDSGCLCLTKEQGQFLYNRGGNGREWF